MDNSKVDAYYKKIGKLVKLKREHAGKSQTQLSKYLNFKSRISIVNIENGDQKVHVHTLALIAKYLNVAINELIPPIENTKEDDISIEFADQLSKEGLNKKSSKSIAQMISNLDQNQ